MRQLYTHHYLRRQANSDAPKIVKAIDSPGNSLLVNGSGFLKGFDSNWGGGQVENECKVGNWKGVDSTGKLLFEEEFVKGKLINGRNFQDNQTYRYTEARRQPDFNGGQAGLYKFLSQNIRYPKEALKSDIQRTISVHFVVRSNGEIA